MRTLSNANHSEDCSVTLKVFVAIDGTGNHSSPKHAVEYRPITTLPLNNLNRQPIKTDYRTMPSLTSFRGPDIKMYPVSSHPLQSDTPYNHAYTYATSDKVHPSSRNGSAYTCLSQIKNSSTGNGRHVTFSTNQSRGGPGGLRDEPPPPPLPHAFGRISPYSPGYETMLPAENGGLYISGARSGDEDDGNTTTSGSYTIDSDNLNDSITSA
ncbi:hypothetical protein Btru_015005 [Bulinus truncatus]|nr:hypothetical protein Btru_015005 [Bulinus truncatus]